MRDEHSLDLTGMSLDSNRDFYSDGGEIFVNGPTIRANCVIVNNSQVREDQAGTASKSIDKLTQNYVCDYGGEIMMSISLLELLIERVGCCNLILSFGIKVQ